MLRKPAVVLLALACAFAFLAAKRRAVRHPAGETLTLSLERSFVVTDRDIVSAFRLERVLDSLAARSGVAGLTGEKLYRQWFDTQNPKPGLDASMPHCDDTMTDGAATLNGFAIRCPTTEGALATRPYVPDDFVPIAVVNRFDQADAAGAHCGQYRIVYSSRAVGPDEALRVIFEAVLPNPRPEHGLAGCRPVAQFWADLSSVDSLAERRARLETFFFDGVGGFAPAVHPEHFERSHAGVRTLQRTRPDMLASFRQFRIVRECSTAGCRLYFKPDVLENFVNGAFFDANDTSDRARRTREAFLATVKTLAIRDVNLYHMKMPADLLIGDSHPKRDNIPFSLGATFQRAVKTAAGEAFRAEIAAELQKAGSTLTPQQAILRAETQDCVGCHFLGAKVGEGVEFPSAFDGQEHISDRELLAGQAGPATRFAISPALANVFVPHRMQILRDFLKLGKAPVHSN